MDKITQQLLDNHKETFEKVINKQRAEEVLKLFSSDFEAKLKVSPMANLVFRLLVDDRNANLYAIIESLITANDIFTNSLHSKII